MSYFVKIFVFIMTSIVSIDGWALPADQIEKLNNVIYFLPQTACREGLFLQRCFKVDNEQCLLAAKKSSKSCLNLSANALKNDSESSLKLWINKIDNCVFRDLSLQWKKHAIRNPACILPDKEIL